MGNIGHTLASAHAQMRRRLRLAGDIVANLIDLPQEVVDHYLKNKDQIPTALALAFVVRRVTTRVDLATLPKGAVVHVIDSDGTDFIIKVSRRSRYDIRVLGRRVAFKNPIIQSGQVLEVGQPFLVHYDAMGGQGVLGGVGITTISLSLDGVLA